MSEGMFIVESRWFRLAAAGPDQRRQLRFEIGRHGWPKRFCEEVYNALVHRTNDESPAVRAGRDKPNLTASRRRSTGPDVSMKRPEAGSSPACTTYAA